jgi:hypothetical protein
MILVFSVLCLTVFSLIAFVVAINDKVLADTEAQLVVGYYEADTLAEQILAVILTSDEIPNHILGVDIETDWDWDLLAETVRFFCPISDKKALYVKLAIYVDTYDILSWRMWDTDEWEIDESMGLWTGPDLWEVDEPLNVWQGDDWVQDNDLDSWPEDYD